MTELAKSSFSQDFSKVLIENGFLLNAERVPLVIDILFQGGTKFLKESMKDDAEGKPHAITFRADPYAKEGQENPVIFTMSLSKIKGEDEDSFNLQYSFDDSIIEEGSVVNDFYDKTLFNYYRITAADYGASFVMKAGMSTIQMVFVKLIQYFKEFIRNNMDTDNTLEYKNYFKIEGILDDDKKLSFKITPSELMKQFVKSDDKDETAA